MQGPVENEKEGSLVSKSLGILRWRQQPVHRAWGPPEHTYAHRARPGYQTISLQKLFSSSLWPGLASAETPGHGKPQAQELVRFKSWIHYLVSNEASASQ